MKIVHRIGFLIVLALCHISAFAQISFYQFTLYESQGSDLATPGRIVGYFQADLNGNLFTNVKPIELAYAPGYLEYGNYTVPAPMIYKSISTYSWDPVTGLLQRGGSVLSIDGTQNNFVFSDLSGYSFGALSNPAGQTAYVYVSPTNISNASLLSYSPVNGSNFGPYWTSSASLVPEPKTYFLMILGFFLVMASSRRVFKGTH